MREVISLNGKPVPHARVLTAFWWDVPVCSSMLTIHAYSRPGRLPDCKLVLGGESMPESFLCLFSALEKTTWKIIAGA